MSKNLPIDKYVAAKIVLALQDVPPLPPGVKGEKGLFHTVYKFTRIETGEVYVGKHGQPTDPGLEKHGEYKYWGSGLRFNNAIKAHGKHAFVREIIAYFATNADAAAFERHVVCDEFIKRRDTYNLRPGGDGLAPGSEYTREMGVKGAAANRAQFDTEEEYKAWMAENVAKGRAAKRAKFDTEEEYKAWQAENLAKGRAAQRAQFDSEEEYEAWMAENRAKGRATQRAQFDSEEEYKAWMAKKSAKGRAAHRAKFDSEEEYKAWMAENAAKGRVAQRAQFDTEEEYRAYMAEKGIKGAAANRGMATWFCLKTFQNKRTTVEEYYRLRDQGIAVSHATRAAKEAKAALAANHPDDILYIPEELRTMA